MILCLSPFSFKLEKTDKNIPLAWIVAQRLHFAVYVWLSHGYCDRVFELPVNSS